MCDPCGVPCCNPCDPCCGGPYNEQVRSCKSRELRAGILYTNCDCIRRNGLQDSCPRSQCQGSPQCMVMPDPTCCPSQYPRQFQYMTMGLDKRRLRNPCGGNATVSGGYGNATYCEPSLMRACEAGGGMGNCMGNGMGGAMDFCGGTRNGLNNPMTITMPGTNAYCSLADSYGSCDPPIPLPPMCISGVCPPLREGGAPDPSIWSPCSAPGPYYPCYV